MANGLADDIITATCLATSAPVVVAPAMDGDMYAHPATVANVATLRGFGYTVIDPVSGPLASGQVGVGRLVELPVLVEAVTAVIGDQPVRQPDPAGRPPRSVQGRGPDLAGWRIVVTAGGTAEPIDPVRFIGNRSSGRMGFAIAEAALLRGAAVTLIKGMTSAEPPAGVEIVEAETAMRMREAVLEALPGSDALVMAAAVADFRPRQAADQKLPRSEGLGLELEPTADILAEAASLARQPKAGGGERPLIVGFAAETGSVERAAEKAVRKGVDLLVANDVSEPGSGFGSETNRVTFIQPGREPEARPLAPKVQVAHDLLDRLVALRASAGASGASLGPT
jgi:phosphopantothenoylcysteine decarboxylase/phosphopantothenate--cysteine ligase